MASLSYNQIRQYAVNAGFQGQSADTITQIALAESGGNPYAINASDPHGGSYGLTQINGIHSGAQSTYGDPQQAMNMAYSVSNGGTNFSPWSTYTSGAYTRFASGEVAQGPAGSGYGSSSVDPYAMDPGSFTYGGGQQGASSTTPGTTSLAQTGENTAAAAEASMPGFVPPAQTGGPAAFGLIPGLAEGIGGWISGLEKTAGSITTSIESAVGDAFKKAMEGVLGTATNWALRAIVIFLAVIIIAIALWRLMDPTGEKTRAMVSTAAKAA